MATTTIARCVSGALALTHHMPTGVALFAVSALILVLHVLGDRRRARKAEH